MKIYIAGKITGLPYDEAAALFGQAEHEIARAGHTPLNPLVLVDQTEGRHYNEYLADALVIMLKQAEAVYFLDNWIDSKGARIEFAIANETDMTIYRHLDELPLGCDWPEQV